MVPED